MLEISLPCLWMTDLSKELEKDEEKIFLGLGEALRILVFPPNFHLKKITIFQFALLEGSEVPSCPLLRPSAVMLAP